MRVLLTLLLVACGGSEDPHAVGACEGYLDNQGNPFTGTCEAACKTKPQVSGQTCDTKVQLACNAIEFDGYRGCCIQDGTVIRFYECQN